MHELVQQHRAALETLCRKHRVARLDLFGSAVSQRFDACRSDLDFLVVFHPDAKRGLKGDFFGLQRDLERLFGRSVDLVEAGAIHNPYFQREVDRERVTLYAA